MRHALAGACAALLLAGCGSAAVPEPQAAPTTGATGTTGATATAGVGAPSPARTRPTESWSRSGYRTRTTPLPRGPAPR
ncbi:myosin-1 [Modestobacter roseus]|uniref:Myosin-1 n=1 Tax=Modestobacter roseus TaxID=1181884 RepID=A0A562IML5_9ACTN|nr:myosin-1 [Modestobacter roseus]